MQLSFSVAGWVRSQISLDCWQVLRMEAKSQLTTCRFTLMSLLGSYPLPGHIFPRGYFLMKDDSCLAFHLF